MRLVKFRRGSTLILALLIVGVIFLAGLGFLAQAAEQYKAAGSAGRSTQALALAEAGLQDALTKLRRDWDFPPRSADDQVVFTYLESLRNTKNEVVGSYEVAIDRRLVIQKKDVLIIRSTGRIGSLQEPEAERVLQIEFDLDKSRSTYFKIVSWTDLGGF